MANEHSNPPSSLKKLGLPKWVIVLFVATFVLFPFLGRRDAPSPMQNQAAPDFTVVDRMHSKTTLSEYKGKLVFINFWASWCAPCMEEMPSLRKMEEELKSKKFKLLAINVDENLDKILKDLPLEKMPEGLYFDMSDSDIAPYKVSSIPISYLVDGHGAVVKVYRGPEDWMSNKTFNEISRLLPPE